MLASSDHKFLLNAGRGMGYCYLSPDAQARFTPINAGWRAGRVPFESFFGPEMDLSPTASRFDSSISWLAAIGNEAALEVFDDFGADAIYARNVELTDAAPLDARRRSGGTRSTLPEQNRSTIVSVPARTAATRRRCSARLAEQGVACSARDGNLRVSRPLLQPRGRHRAPGRGAAAAAR